MSGGRKVVVDGTIYVPSEAPESDYYAFLDVDDVESVIAAGGPIR